MTPEEFRQKTDVSRETLDRLIQYERLLSKWQPAINLVSRGSIRDIWRRHFFDSAQIFPLLPKPTGVLVDLGSGGGFPGLVLAALGSPGAINEIHLIESDGRKAAFLREATRVMDLKAEIHHCRIEAYRPRHSADVVTARALAPLPELLGYVERLVKPVGKSFLFKGKEVSRELTEAAKHWKMDCRTHPSKSDASGVILEISNLERIG